MVPGVVAGQPRQEAGVTGQLGRAAVVGVAPARGGEDHHARPQRPQPMHQPLARRPVVLDPRVGEPKVLPDAHPQDARRGRGFLRAQRHRPAGAHLPGGQVQHPRTVPGVDRPDQRAAAGQLGVVGVGGDGQQVQRLHLGLLGRLHGHHARMLGGHRLAGNPAARAPGRAPTAAVPETAPPVRPPSSLRPGNRPRSPRSDSCRPDTARGSGFPWPWRPPSPPDTPRCTGGWRAANTRDARTWAPRPPPAAGAVRTAAAPPAGRSALGPVPRRRLRPRSS